MNDPVLIEVKLRDIIFRILALRGHMKSLKFPEGRWKVSWLTVDSRRGQGSICWLCTNLVKPFLWSQRSYCSAVQYNVLHNALLYCKTYSGICFTAVDPRCARCARCARDPKYASSSPRQDYISWDIPIQMLMHCIFNAVDNDNTYLIICLRIYVFPDKYLRCITTTQLAMRFLCLGHWKKIWHLMFVPSTQQYCSRKN